MKSIAVTGANGFIGAELCGFLQAKEVGVFRLTRNPRPTPPAIGWQLGEPLPSECDQVDAIVHLASATLGENRSVDDARDIDTSGTQILIESVRALRKQGRKIRFIFISSQSARANAANVYGQSKWQIENMLDQPDEICVRPGLVYSEPAASVFLLFQKLARLPFVPAVKSAPAIQPIHVHELAECIARICVMDSPPRMLSLGSVEPLTFEQAIRATAARNRTRAPIMISIPPAIVRSAARIIDGVFHPEPPIGERVDGLLGLHPMDTSPSLAALGISLRPLSDHP